ncbi:M23 family metallopeptidase [Blastococcus brunescens]|uniref:M23 family metallopeptidase n=1 Tax=Blastococcus brunescens TaxID=1564165 RepID=A0ABZ1AVE4_9ACTN|nr:M23 family metallopeptidase [Blastococcus sp. BMG 8361]WRL62533.1 M23 family metallopeptidase [Blastococcus sp. BMG 8361]
MRPRAVVLAVLCAGLALLPAAAAAGPARPTSAPAAPAAPAAPESLWEPPLRGDLAVTRPFDQLPHPYAAGHRGADLTGRPGQPVLAAGAGVVVFAGLVAGRPVVSIDHSGGLRTTYEPVDPLVGAGQQVARGSPIGALGTGHAGCPGEACLHWGLRRGETYLDPLLLLRPPRVRLLPVLQRESASAPTAR